MDTIQRGVQETEQLYRAALAENRGLRKRLKTERQVVRGFLKGLVDPNALDRLIAHLDVLVGKVEAFGEHGAEAAASPTSAVDPETVALLKEIVGLFNDLGNGETRNPKTYVRLLNDCTAALARLTLQPAAAPAKVVVDPEVHRAISMIAGMLNQHVVRADHIERTEAIIGNAAKRLLAVLDRLPRTA